MTPSVRSLGAAVTVLIADDEAIARAALRDMLGDYPWVATILEASNGLAAVESIDRDRPDLVFLDIQMPGLLGTEVLRRVEHRPFVVFTTAYGQHAVTAFELGAVDYLLKPFGAARLHGAMERARASLDSTAAQSSLARLDEALSSGPMTRLYVRAGNAIIPVLVSDVSWFEAQGDFVVAHVGSTPRWLSLSLNTLEARLDTARFARIHRTHIVNLDRVKAFRRHGKGRLVAELTDGTQLTVSRKKAQELRVLGV